MLEERLQVLEARLRLLEDRSTLQQMLAALGPRLDGSPAADIAAFYSERGEYKTDIIGAVPAVGLEQIAAAFDGDMHRTAVKEGAGHLTGPAHIVIQGDRAEAFCHTVLFRSVNGAWMVARVAANRFWCERTVQGWRIVRRINRMLGTEEARSLFRTGAVDLPWDQKPPSPLEPVVST
jgi:hypothetical protein